MAPIARPDKRMRRASPTERVRTRAWKRVADATLAHRDRIGHGRSMIDPRPVTLAGRHVRLEPMQSAHLDAFIAIGLGQEIFRWFPYAVETPDDMRSFVETALDGQSKGLIVPFTTIESSSGQVVGSTSFLNIDRTNRRLEVGATWLGVRWQRTVCNTEAKWLQLRHCFEDLGGVRA